MRGLFVKKWLLKMPKKTFHRFLYRNNAWLLAARKTAVVTRAWIFFGRKNNRKITIFWRLGCLVRRVWYQCQ
jgi:hypothetical protein